MGNWMYQGEHNIYKWYILSLPFLLILIAAGVLSAIDNYGKNSRIYSGAVGGIGNHQVATYIVETSQEAYDVWKRLGVRGRTLLFIADRWRKLDVNELFPPIPMTRKYPLILNNIPETMEQRGVTSSNFLYIAALNGIARRVVAVLPKRGFDEMAEMARGAKNSKISSDTIYLTHQGFPRWFTTEEHLIQESEPVLLYIEASYFREEEPEKLFDKLVKSRITLDSLVLCTGSDDSSVTGRETEKMQRFAKLAGIGSNRSTEPYRLQRLDIP